MKKQKSMMNTTDIIYWKDVPYSPTDLKFSKPYPIKKITSSLENIKVPDDWKKHVDIRLVKPEYKKFSCFMHTGQSNEWSTLRQIRPAPLNSVSNQSAPLNSVSNQSAPSNSVSNQSAPSNSVSNKKCTCKQSYPLNSSFMTVYADQINLSEKVKKYF